MALRRIFWGFCRNWFLMSPLHYLSGPSNFGFEFAEIFIFKKRLPAINDTGCRRLSVSVIWGGLEKIDTPGNLVDSPKRVFIFRIRISPRIRSQNRNSSKCSVRDLCQSDLCKNLGKFSSLPCPFKLIKIWVWDLGSGKKPIPDPRPQHCN
jgi:hypothetical protein